jgi:RNA polymerase sigma factor (TIGR02999 family)
LRPAFRYSFHEMSENPPTSPSDSALAAADLIPIVYDELRRLARSMVATEAPQTLSATALVNEAWLRIGGDTRWPSRRAFFGAAAVAMRRILIERARAKARIKRGGRPERVDLDDVEIESPTAGEDIVALDDALTKLAAEDPVAGEIVNLRHIVGLTWAEIADLTRLSERELGRQWEYARAWLRAEMGR